MCKLYKRMVISSITSLQNISRVFFYSSGSTESYWFLVGKGQEHFQASYSVHKSPHNKELCSPKCQ